MGLFKRIVTEITRRPFRTIILAIAILVLSVLSMIGVFLQNAVNMAYQEYVKLEGYSIVVESRSGETIPSELIDQILTLDHVVGYNDIGGHELDYKPVNFMNTPYKSNSYTSVSTSEDITLYGNISTNLYSTFRNGNMILKDGAFPSSHEKGVIIDSVLAAKNGLDIGKEIELYSDTEDKTITFEIIGIYETLQAPEIRVDNSQGTYYTISPNSYIFCDYDSFFELLDSVDPLRSLVFYVDEHENIETVYNKIQEIAPEEKYLLINCLESTLSEYGAVVVALEGTSSGLLKFTYITSLVILFLMTLLWMRDHYYEAGIYIALGTEKIKIVLYFITEILIIALITLGVSLIIGRGVIYTYGEKILDIATGFTNSKFLDKNIQIKVLDSAFSYQSILSACGIYLLIVVISTLLSSIAIANYNPRKLFDED